MKPIEKGCLALIVHSKAGHAGKTVTVGSYLGAVKGWYPDGRWEIDREVAGTNGEMKRHYPGKWLMRIDGYKEETKERELEHG